MQARHDQVVLALSAQEDGPLQRAGTRRMYARSQLLFESGESGHGLVVMLSGRVALVRREGLGHSERIAEFSLPLDTNVPGVFAVGDLRSGSVKRVGGAIGEGAQVVQSVHAIVASDKHVDGGRRRGGIEG